ncbi:accessory gene regulator protein C [Oceanobacillus picturae]|uniref:Accessory gene regulator protein C n=2 Tax=Oceanobacillus picturae TaxID=171693 RepID=A0A0U9H1K4_9BACI|nr:accessory gene regulator protein C [Oceanobacillus picturae]
MSSLPVKRASIVQGRYVSILMVSIFFILYQGLCGRVLSLLFENNYYVYSWKDMLVLLCMAALIVAVGIPLYYGLTSFLMATGTLAFLYFFSIIFSLPSLTNVLGMEQEIIFNDLDPGLVLLVEKYIPFQTYVTLSLVTAILFYLSLKLSEQLFVKRAKVT